VFGWFRFCEHGQFLNAGEYSAVLRHGRPSLNFSMEPFPGWRRQKPEETQSTWRPRAGIIISV
jgi:hypothetical protein